MPDDRAVQRIVVETPVMIPVELSPSRPRLWPVVRLARKAMLNGLLLCLAYQRPREPFERATVQVEYRTHPGKHRDGYYRPRDPDNAASAGNKSLLDALVLAGYIVDDSAEHVAASAEWTLREVEPGDAEGLVITVREVSGGD